MSKRFVAFTLIELLIAISILAILTGIGVISYTGIQLRARDAQRVNDLNQIKVALVTYYNAQVPTQFVSAGTAITINSTNDALTTALEPNYIKDVPVDPLNAGNNVYKYQSFNSGKDFTLYGTLENKNNKKGYGGGSSWVVNGYQVNND